MVSRRPVANRWLFCYCSLHRSVVCVMLGFTSGCNVNLSRPGCADALSHSGGQESTSELADTLASRKPGFTSGCNISLSCSGYIYGLPLALIPCPQGFKGLPLALVPGPQVNQRLPLALIPCSRGCVCVKICLLRLYQGLPLVALKPYLKGGQCFLLVAVIPYLH